METQARTIAKALCWQALGVVVMTLIGYLFTGSVSEGGAIAAVSTLVGLLTYIIHERLWAHIAWGRDIVIEGRHGTHHQRTRTDEAPDGP